MSAPGPDATTAPGPGTAPGPSAPPCRAPGAPGLATARLDVLGRLREASNATLLCALDAPDAALARLTAAPTAAGHGPHAAEPHAAEPHAPEGPDAEGPDPLDDLALAVYKPVAGEAPLADFAPGTLARREVAAYVVDHALGWHLVPATVLRDGPHGPGSVQRWITATAPTERLLDLLPAADVPHGWLRVLEGDAPDGTPVALAHADDPALLRLAVLDAVLNNADRKGGHVLVHDDHVHGIDHGLVCHHRPKLRTVLWGWGGHGLPDPVLGDLRRLRTGLEAGLPAPAGTDHALVDLLAPHEVEALAARVDRLVADGALPGPDPRRTTQPRPQW